MLLEAFFEADARLLKAFWQTAVAFPSPAIYILIRLRSERFHRIWHCVVFVAGNKDSFPACDLIVSLCGEDSNHIVTWKTCGQKLNHTTSLLISFTSSVFCNSPLAFVNRSRLSIEVSDNKMHLIRTQQLHCQQITVDDTGSLIMRVWRRRAAKQGKRVL